MVEPSADMPLDAAFGIPDELSLNDIAEATRNRALLQSSAEAVQSLEASGVLALQNVLEHGDSLGIWRTPVKWRPNGAKATQNVDLRSRINHFFSALSRGGSAGQQEVAVTPFEVARVEGARARAEHLLDIAVLTAHRYLVLCRMGPARLGNTTRSGSLDPSTVAIMAYQSLPPLLGLAVAKAWEHGHDARDGLLRLVMPTDLARLTAYQRAELETEFQRFRAFQERGFWSDVPGIAEPAQATASVKGPPAPRPKQPKTSPHLPLPDDYVSEMGSRSLWFIQDLTPNLLLIAQEIAAMWGRTDLPELTPNKVGDLRTEEFGNFLRKFVWRNGAGEVMQAPPFSIRLSQLGAKPKRNERGSDGEAVEDLDASHWPPRHFSQVMGLLHAAQTAHVFVVAMSMGARKSEVLDLKRWCLQPTANGLPYASGRTFKLVERHEGEVRDWVLPDIATVAIEQQVRLVRLSETIGPRIPEREGVAKLRTVGQHLWAQMGSNSLGDRTQPLTDMNRALQSLAKTLGLGLRPGGQNLRSHRIRKTVARLVALALTQAPKVLMQVFGHRAIEMTLYYILTDKELQAEIEQVSRELRVMRAKEVVEAMVTAEGSDGPALGGFGGPAAPILGKAIAVHKTRLHQRGEDWGAESALELAEILTLNGKAWQFVRPGVLCTKFPGTESGPCNKSKGHPEPSRCQSKCQHRLEEAFLREDVDGAIADAVGAYEKAGLDGQQLVQSLWAGQIRAHLTRFDDIRLKWVQHPTVRLVTDEVTA